MRIKARKLFPPPPHRKDRQMTLLKNDEQRAAWRRITAFMEAEKCDGINAEGEYSEAVHDRQRAYIKGMGRARLAAIRALATKDQPHD